MNLYNVLLCAPDADEGGEWSSVHKGLQWAAPNSF